MPSLTSGILVDSHVHLYDCFDLGLFLDSSLANFRAEQFHHKLMDTCSAFLLLTETSDNNRFQSLARYVDKCPEIGSRFGDGWVLHRTNESFSLLAQCNSYLELYLTAGRQIITAENLEVLALITDWQFEDGKPIREVIELVKERGGIPVIPWGFGKWMGNRGRILERSMRESRAQELFLGDNGGRPICLPRPSHFDLAQTLGIRILPGSDPLPFSSEYWRPGSFGFWMRGAINHEHPGKDLKRILLDPSTVPKPYGKLEKPYRFLGNQLKMQLNKQLRKRKALSS